MTTWTWELPATATWSVCVRDANTGEVLAAHTPEILLKTASIGKIFLLAEAARALAAGELAADEPLTWRDDELIGDSGLWHRLSLRTLPAVDVCALVGAVSDNVGTNVLVRRLGLDPTRAMARRLGCAESHLVDRIRLERTPDTPPTTSLGRADELSAAMTTLHRCSLGLDDTLPAGIAAQTLAWLGANTDLSMVAAGFDLDPLGHDEFDRGIWLRNKTGTISTARIDVGVAHTPDGRALAWMVGANWSEDVDPRDDVLAAMRALGADLRHWFEG